MSEDRWSVFAQHEAQQRQERAAKAQRIFEEDARKKKEAEHQHLLREQARIAAEQRQVEERRIAKQQANEKRRDAEGKRNAVLAQSAEDLRQANQRMRDAQIAATQKHQEEVQAKEKTWFGCDGKEFRSPIERDFWNEWLADSERAANIPLIPQHKIGKYRVDFACIASKTAIELDGRAWHTDRYAFTHDRVRQRALEKEGWCFIRFSADEISTSVVDRVIETYEIIRGRRG